MNLFTELYGRDHTEQVAAKKSVVVFKEHLAVDEAKDFIEQNNLKPFSLTFRGDGYACGGTIESASDIDKVVNTIIEGWGDEVADSNLPDDYRDSVKIRISNVKKNGLKVKDIEVLGDVPDSIQRSDRVQKVMAKH